MKVEIPYYTLFDGSPKSVYFKTVNATIKDISGPNKPAPGQLLGDDYMEIIFTVSKKDLTYNGLRAGHAKTIAAILNKRNIEELVGEEITLIFDEREYIPIGFLKPSEKITLEK